MTGPRHGTRTGYRWHTENRVPTCGQCRAWRSAAGRSYRRRRYLAHEPLSMDATGTRRRIQALAAIGWPLRELATRLDVLPSAVNHWTRRPLVHRSTAVKVAELFEQLSMTLGPSARARTCAQKAGWPPPLAWGEDIDDPDAVSSMELERAHDEALVENRRRDRNARQLDYVRRRRVEAA